MGARISERLDAGLTRHLGGGAELRGRALPTSVGVEKVVRNAATRGVSGGRTVQLARHGNFPLLVLLFAAPTGLGQKDSSPALSHKGRTRRRRYRPEGGARAPISAEGRWNNNVSRPGTFGRERSPQGPLSAPDKARSTHFSRPT